VSHKDLEVEAHNSNMYGVSKTHQGLMRKSYELKGLEGST